MSSLFNRIFKTSLRRTAFWLSLSFLTVFVYSCRLTDENLSFAPEDQEEAELIALCLSGDLEAPDSLYSLILSNLGAVRSKFGERFEAINRIRFKPPWVESCIIIGFDEGTYQLVKSGEYDAWDELNSEYQVTEIDARILSAAVLYFKGVLHPRRLSEFYRGLPGVRYVEPNHFIGDFSNVYPRQTLQGMTYLFRNAWGDCPAGCISSEYWYFRVSGTGGVSFVGYWAFHLNDKPPSWWFEAEKNIELYRKW